MIPNANIRRFCELICIYVSYPLSLIKSGEILVRISRPCYKVFGPRWARFRSTLFVLPRHKWQNFLPNRVNELDL